MPKPKKAARGKHRWIGFRVNNILTREELENILKTHLDSSEWRLFDIQESEKNTFAILKISLKQFKQTIVQINNSKNMGTITSSGKIILVRKRLNSILRKYPSDAV